MIDYAWLGYLAIPTAWTVYFSMFMAPRIRGWRNLGWPACYVLGFVMLGNVGWRRAGATWAAVGLATGLLYLLYEAWPRRSEGDAPERVRLSTVLHGVAVWPIMLPEVIEYSLAGAGVLRAKPRARAAGAAGGDGESGGS